MFRFDTLLKVKEGDTIDILIHHKDDAETVAAIDVPADYTGEPLVLSIHEDQTKEVIAIAESLHGLIGKTLETIGSTIREAVAPTTPVEPDNTVAQDPAARKKELERAIDEVGLSFTNERIRTPQDRKLFDELVVERAEARTKRVEEKFKELGIIF